MSSVSRLNALFLGPGFESRTWCLWGCVPPSGVGVQKKKKHVSSDDRSYLYCHYNSVYLIQFEIKVKENQLV